MSDRPTLPEGVDELEIYRRMRVARRFDERVLALRTSNVIEGPTHPAIGQEAVAVGVCAHLRTDEKITSTHRGHAHTISKGADLKRMMAELYGRDEGYCHGIGGSMHIADFDIGMLGANGIVAAGLPIALGAALANKLDNEPSAVVCFFSDGAVGAGPFHECLNIAALWQLPVLFLCENNGWAAGAALEETVAAESPHLLAEGYGVAHSLVDGNDVLAVMKATKTALDHVRSGKGPYLLEARTMRISVHAVRENMPPDNRDAVTMQEWATKDPLERHSKSMLSRGVATQSDLDRIHAEVEGHLDEAIAFAEGGHPPQLDRALEAFRT